MQRIVIIEGDGFDLLRDVVVREAEPPRQLAPVFVGTGPGRGAFEDATTACYCPSWYCAQPERCRRVVAVAEYLPPRRRAA